MDDVLNLFLRARNDNESELFLERLICDHAQPLIRKIVGFKLRALSSATDDRDVREMEDVCSEVTLKLVRRLRQFKSAPEETPVANLRGYVAAMAYNE